MSIVHHPMPDIIAGKYEVLETIGRGGMGTVYKALQRNLDRVVAVKMLSEELAADPEFRARFQQEATIIARLNHPNIVAVHDIEPHNHTFCIIMEYLEGETLQAKIDRDVVLSERDALSVAAQVARALHYAHEHGIVHRDIKPDNIHISADGVVKVMDFGIARFLQSKLKTQTGISMGTPRFMSPEQVTGKNVDGQTDLYSLGICLYMALTGRVPFDGENAITIATRHLYEPPEAPSAINPSITPGAEKVVLKALEKGKADRYRDGAEMATALEAALQTRSQLRLDDGAREVYSGSTQKMPAVHTAAAISANPQLLSGSSTPPVAVSTPTGIHRLEDAVARDHERARQTVRDSTISTTDVPQLQDHEFPETEVDSVLESSGRWRLLRRFWPVAVALLLVAAAAVYLLSGPPAAEGGRPNSPALVPPRDGTLEKLQIETDSLVQQGKIPAALKRWRELERTHENDPTVRNMIVLLSNRLPLSQKEELATRRMKRVEKLWAADRSEIAAVYLNAARQLHEGSVPKYFEDLIEKRRPAKADTSAAAHSLGRAEELLRQARPAQAEEALLDAVSADSRNFLPWLRLGEFYRDQKLWDDARVTLQRAADLASGADRDEIQRRQQEVERGAELK